MCWQENGGGDANPSGSEHNEPLPRWEPGALRRLTATGVLPELLAARTGQVVRTWRCRSPDLLARVCADTHELLRHGLLQAQAQLDQGERIVALLQGILTGQAACAAPSSVQAMLSAVPVLSRPERVFCITALFAPGH